jgi:hypothetical protein
MNMMRSVLSGKIKSLFFTVVMFLSFQFMNVSTFGQAGEESEIKPGTDCLQKDLGDLLHKYKPRLKPPRSTMLLIFPNLSYNPANGVLMGIAGSAGLYLGLKEDTRVSSLAFNAAYTTKDQFLFFVKSNIYTNNNKLFLQGDLRYFIYNAYTWGLGTNAPDSIQTNNALVWQGIQTGDIENGYPLDYNYLKIHEVLNWKLSKITTQAWAIIWTIFIILKTMHCKSRNCPTRLHRITFIPKYMDLALRNMHSPD